MSTAEVVDWVIDTNHSTFEFAVRHMKVATIKGMFSEVSGAIHYDPHNPTAASVNAEIQMASIDTHNGGRDGHLRGEGYFDVEQFPTASFASRLVEATNGDHFRVTGDLTLHGATNEVVFDTIFEGIQLMPNDQLRAAFTARAIIKRTDFGFGAGTELPGGGHTVSNDVQLAMFTTCNPSEA